MPHHHQVEALYVIDHRGQNPRGDGDLVPYSRPFQKILSGCAIGVDDLTNMAIHLSDQASTVGGRNVTSLQMLKSIARRVTWHAPHRACRHIYNLAEGHLEAGDP